MTTINVESDIDKLIEFYPSIYDKCDMFDKLIELYIWDGIIAHDDYPIIGQLYEAVTDYINNTNKNITSDESCKDMGNEQEEKTVNDISITVEYKGKTLNASISEGLRNDLEKTHGIYALEEMIRILLPEVKSMIKVLNN
jgi:hypothetical protein